MLDGLVHELNPARRKEKIQMEAEKHKNKEEAFHEKITILNNF